MRGTLNTFIEPLPKKDLNNKKRHHKTHQRRPGCVLAARLEPPGRRAPTGLAIKEKMAPLPACHLVAFPEPVAAALFRPGLNVPPAPRGPRSWSALTRRPCPHGHPRGARPGPPQAPTGQCLQASPAVPDPARLLPSRGSGHYARPGGKGFVTLQHPCPQVRGLRGQPTRPPWGPEVQRLCVPETGISRIECSKRSR